MTSFPKAFFRALRWRPRQALAALYWYVTRRKVRARNTLRLGTALAPYAYDAWVETVEDNASLAANAGEITSHWARRPEFSILLHAPTGTKCEAFEATLASLREQYYPKWTLIVASGDAGQCGSDEIRDLPSSKNIRASDDVDALSTGVTAASGDFIVPICAGTLLSPSALFRFVEGLQGDVRPDIIYGDQDEVDVRGRRARPWFKPDWDKEMFLAQDYLSDACAISLPLAREALSIACMTDQAATFSLLLAATQRAVGPIKHVQHIVSHVKIGSISNQAARVIAVARHLEQLGASAVPGPFATVRAVWPLPQEAPGVSIIVPTRDKLEILRPCVESVLDLTTYRPFELIIADNGSADQDTLDYLFKVSKRAKVRVIPYDRPYNYSAINNFAVSEATHPFICLLNNDTEVLAGDWLTELMRYAVQPDVGAAGAKLLYDDGSIQHAGVVIGICEAAGHAHRFERANEPGYFAQTHLAHVVSAVTAACLVVEKSKFLSVGGFDAEDLAIAYNDVDLCLKLERAGWRNMYVPHATLLHHESKSRGQDFSPKNIDRYKRELSTLQKRWGTVTYEDPRHNRNLDRYSETFILRV
jgi:O-antigen biosynthesis protein